MKWVLASIGLLIVIVVFSLAALDQKDVVWLDGKPHCPHCRVVVEPYSEVCRSCQRAYDWDTYERPCPACLSDLDADFLRGVYENRTEEFRRALKEAGADDKVVADLELYLQSVRGGACGYCGGTGRWLAAGFKDGTAGADRKMTGYLMIHTEGACPVCLGEKRCALCEGEREVECGGEEPYRVLLELKKRMNCLNTPADPVSAKERFQEIQSFFRRIDRQEEILEIPSYDVSGDTHMGRAIRRIRYLKDLLNRLAE